MSIQSLPCPRFTLPALAALLCLGPAAHGAGLGYKDTPLIPGTSWHVHDGDRPQPRIITPGATFSQMAAAPSDAIVLFDGKDLSKWEHGNGKPGSWKIENGYMEVVPKSGILRTKDKFKDFQLHLEFATPSKVEGSGQGRGNNGVNIWGRYEIQVLDSYENKTYPDGQAGAIYGQTPPLVNASRPPGEWQTYDIIWEGPRWDAQGTLTRKAYVTVLHNGAVVHHRRELLGGTNHRSVGNYKTPIESGRIELYEHGNPVRFRNIWLRPLTDYDQP
ncbi:MAG: hypothetical protein RJA22_175 [Verrucomicrobiota bacterium]|jgi:hypothetical protein